MSQLASSATGAHLRLVWPQWQGAGSDSVRELNPDFPFDIARRGYTVGSAVLQAVLPAHVGPTWVVPVEMTDRGLEEQNGVEAKTVVLEQLRKALDAIAEVDPDRITTLGGDCSVSAAPFSYLLDKYGDDLAVVWIDSHPDMSTPQDAYSGHHAMVVSALTGHGDPDILSTLPATTSPERVALVGMHDWTDPALPPVAEEWGLTVFPPDALRTSSTALLNWIRSTRATKVAIHFDVDTIDADEVQLGLGYDQGGLTTTEARRVVHDISQATDIVALTIAEYTPRQVMRLQQLLADFPLL